MFVYRKTHKKKMLRLKLTLNESVSSVLRVNNSFFFFLFFMHYVIDDSVFLRICSTRGGIFAVERKKKSTYMIKTERRTNMQIFLLEIITK